MGRPGEPVLGPETRAPASPGDVCTTEASRGFSGKLVTCGHLVPGPQCFVHSCTPHLSTPGRLHRLEALPRPVPSLCPSSDDTCPHSARWLRWGLLSPEHIRGSPGCLPGRAAPKSAPCSVGHTLRSRAEDWHTSAGTADRLSWEPPRPSPRTEGRGQQVALPGFDLPPSHLEQVPAAGGGGWPSRGAGRGGAPLPFTLGSFLLTSSWQRLFAEAPTAPRGVPASLHSPFRRPSAPLEVTAGERAVRTRIRVCLSQSLGGAQLTLGSGSDCRAPEGPVTFVVLPSQPVGFWRGARKGRTVWSA